MNQILTSKKIRRVLMLTFLTCSLGIVWLQTGICVGAIPCSEAMSNYEQKNLDFFGAFDSHYHDSPTTCQQECENQNLPPSQIPQCIEQCRINRQTAFGQATLDLFSAAGATCTPYTLDECAAARAMMDSCILQYPYYEYSDPDERSAIFDQFYACRIASKVDNCQ